MKLSHQQKDLQLAVNLFQIAINICAKKNMDFPVVCMALGFWIRKLEKQADDLFMIKPRKGKK